MNLTLVLRRYDRVVAPLRADFNALFQRYASAYGQTRSGKKFLAEICKPISTKKALNNRMKIPVGRLGATAIRDPTTFLLELALIPVVIGATNLIGKFFKDDKTEEQKQFEAVLIQARYAMDRSGVACYQGIFASGAVAVGVIVACALVSFPEFAPEVAASEPSAPASRMAAAPATVSPALAMVVTPAQVVFTPTPEPTAVALREPVATPTPSPVLPAVAEAQRAAVDRCPAVGIEGSELNSAFIARYKLYQQTRPEYFDNAAWPMNLAVEVSHISR